MLWVCVSLSDTAVAMVAEFTQKTQKEDKPEENTGEGRWLQRDMAWLL